MSQRARAPEIPQPATKPRSVQPADEGDRSALPRIAHAPADVAGIPRSPGRGQPLDGSLRRDMERRFGHDFSTVRVREDAAVAARGAGAMTLGESIAFAPGNWDPNRPTSRRLLAHELTHVVQMRAGAHATRHDPRSRLEAEAGHAATQTSGAGLLAVTGVADPGVALFGGEPPTRGLFDGLKSSKLFNLLAKVSPDRAAGIVSSFARVFGGRERSTTDLNGELVEALAIGLEEAQAASSSDPGVPSGLPGLAQGRSGATRVSERSPLQVLMGGLLGIRANRMAEAAGPPSVDDALKTLGIEHNNYDAMRQVAGFRDEVMTIRPVGDDGPSAVAAIQHQRAGLPTKPFSIKMKSERKTGFIPINQFNLVQGDQAAPTAKAINELKSESQVKSAIYIMGDVARVGGRDFLPAAGEETHEELRAWAEAKGEGLPDELARVYRTAGEGRVDVDGHCAMSRGEIEATARASEEAGTAARGLHDHLERTFADTPRAKQYLVLRKLGRPIVGDYDIYNIMPAGDAGRVGLMQNPESREGAGDSTPFVLGAAIDYNVAVRLSGFAGGLVIHHAAEMHNEGNPQKKSGFMGVSSRPTLARAVRPQLGQLQGADRESIEPLVESLVAKARAALPAATPPEQREALILRAQSEIRTDVLSALAMEGFLRDARREHLQLRRRSSSVRGAFPSLPAFVQPTVDEHGASLEAENERSRVPAVSSTGPMPAIGLAAGRRTALSARKDETPKAVPGSKPKRTLRVVARAVAAAGRINSGYIGSDAYFEQLFLRLASGSGE